jgi:predicted flap endonuclease-1-like 5' DNA nuclease
MELHLNATEFAVSLLAAFFTGGIIIYLMSLLRIQSLKRKNDLLAQDLQLAENEMEEARRECSAMLRQKSQKEQKLIRELKDISISHEAELAEMKAEIDLLNRQLASAENRYEAFKVTNERHMLDVEYEISRRDKQLRKAAEDYKELSASAMARQKAYQSLLENRENELENLEKAHADSKVNYERDIQLLQRTLREKEEQISRLNKAIAELNAGITPHGGGQMPGAIHLQALSPRARQLEQIRHRASEMNFANIGMANPEEKDDLKVIHGIGPFVEEKLNALGIFTYRQIANLSERDIRQVGEVIELQPERIEQDYWVEQARTLIGIKT